MTATRLRQNSLSPPVLQLNGEPMENVTSCKYLGVTLTSNLTLSDHITGNARRPTGILYRQFYKWSSPVALSRLYVSLVRPHLEHAAPAWNTYLIVHGHELSIWNLCRSLPSRSAENSGIHHIPSAA